MELSLIEGHSRVHNQLCFALIRAGQICLSRDAEIVQGFGDGIALIVDERTMRGLGIFRLIVPVVAFLSFESIDDNPV